MSGVSSSSTISNCYFSENDEENDSDFDPEQAMEEELSPSSSSSNSSSTTSSSLNMDSENFDDGSDVVSEMDYGQDPDYHFEEDLFMNMIQYEDESFVEEEFDSDEDDISLEIMDCFDIFHDEVINQIPIRVVRLAFLGLLSTNLYHHVKHALEQLERHNRMYEFMLYPCDQVSFALAFLPGDFNNTIDVFIMTIVWTYYVLTCLLDHELSHNAIDDRVWF